MPEYLGDILVATKIDLIPHCVPSYAALAKKIKRTENKPYGPKRPKEGGRGGNGNKLRLIFDTLPKKWQQIIGDPRKTEHILENYYKVDSEIVNFYTSFQFEDKEYLSLEAQDKHITNAAILKAVQKLEIDRRTERLNKGGSIRSINKTLWKDAVSFISMKEDKNPETFICTLPRTYQRFIDDAFKPFKKIGYEGIIKKYKSNSNARKVRSSIEEKLFNDLFSAQEYKPNATDIARQYEAFLSGYNEIVNEITGEVYIPSEYRKVEARTIATYLTKWENEIGTHAKRSGDRQQLMGDFSPYHSFSLPVFAGSLLSIDDRNPPFEYEKGKRMWFYNGLDVASGAFTVFVYGKSKEGIITDFYRQLVRNYHEWGFNLPDTLECESSLNSSFKNTFLREGAMFQNVRIEANNARGKIIERRFGTLRYEVEKQRKGWLARPFAKSESNQPGPQKKTIIPYNQLTQNCLQDIQDWNNMPHKKGSKITKWEYFCENQHQNLQPTNYRAIIPFLGYRTDTSCKVGIIALNNGKYILGENGKIETGEELIRLMKLVEGREIQVRWLDDNQGQIFKAMVFIADQYICEAITKPTPNRANIERTDADNEAMQLFAHYKATIDAYQRIRKNELEPVSVISQRPRTLNTKFIIPQLIQKKNPEQKPVEALEALDDESLEYQPQEHVGGDWRSNFN